MITIEVTLRPGAHLHTSKGKCVHGSFIELADKEAELYIQRGQAADAGDAPPDPPAADSPAE